MTFDEWFDSEMVKYRDNDDMIRALLRAKENMRTGFNAGLQYKDVLTVGLRDKIAMTAMQGMLANPILNATMGEVVEYAYKYADAMLEERLKRPIT